MEIEARNLSHIYMPGSPFQMTAVKSIHLLLRSGELTGIIGKTGSGKSTLVQHFNGLLRPTNGKVLINGESIWADNYDRRRLRRQVGMLFQFPEQQLFEETIAKDIAFGLKQMDLSDEEKQQRVAETLKLVKLDPLIYSSRSPLSLSGGEKRRAALAGVLAMKPEMLILDEPTAGLDPAGRREIMDTIALLQKEQGITVILVTHSMDIAARLCKRLLVLKEGQVVLDGAPEEVFLREDIITESGLDLPPVTRIMKDLAEKKLVSNPLVFEVGTAAKLILSSFRGVSK